MKKKLIKIFADALKISEKEVTDNTSFKNTKHWDSLAMVMMVTAVENEFGIKLNFEDLQKFVSFKAVYDLLKEKGACNE
ncbi:MAG: hypothetical protein A2W23_00825 [Planctomycetes bacterium RBG_16_43_13]|nr:MAG: hypothetical protein A2W23_00825 [Planctomycetes bacterium RBG_16_43_13]